MTLTHQGHKHAILNITVCASGYLVTYQVNGQAYFVLLKMEEFKNKIKFSEGET